MRRAILGAVIGCVVGLVVGLLVAFTPITRIIHEVLAEAVFVYGERLQTVLVRWRVGSRHKTPFPPSRRAAGGGVSR